MDTKPYISMHRKLIRLLSVCLLIPIDRKSVV